jgi:hypothetical protein
MYYEDNVNDPIELILYFYVIVLCNIHNVRGQ